MVVEETEEEQTEEEETEEEEEDLFYNRLRISRSCPYKEQEEEMYLPIIFHFLNMYDQWLMETIQETNMEEEEEKKKRLARCICTHMHHAHCGLVKVSQGAVDQEEEEAALLVLAVTVVAAVVVEKDV